jgi:ABC-type transport system involved in multi-copper enzyme maturation permease subunit
MTWLTWRQFRAQALTGLAVLAAVAIYFLVTGLRLHHTYTADLASCTPLNSCDEVLAQFRQGNENMYHLTEILVLAAPALIGMFWGAPLIGRELETGTHQFVWNQTITRGRWLAVKLTAVGLASIAVAAVLSYLITWWAGPLDHLVGNKFEATTFATRDIVPLAYAAFAFALGATAGLLVRRTVPAMAITLAVFIGIQILIPTLVRPHLLASTTLTFAVNQNTAQQARGFYTNNGGAEMYLDGLPVPAGAWVTSAPPITDSAGRTVAASTHLDCFPPPNPNGGGGTAKAGGPDLTQISACLAPYNLHESITWQPKSHYWPLQWYETGIFGLLAAALSGFCFWQIRRRQN